MTARIDRMTALRRAAAPSLDFSLLPASPDFDGILDEPAPANTVRTWSPVAQTGSQRPSRFDFPVRPGGHPTLQPFDAPLAAALLAGDDNALAQAERAISLPQRGPRPPMMDLEAAIASMESRTAPGIAPPALPTVVPVDEPDLTLVDAVVAPELVVRRHAAPALLPVENTEPPRNLRYLRRDTATTLYDSDDGLLAGWAQEDEEEGWMQTASPADEEVDGELNAWMHRRTRARFVALALSGAIMTLLTAVAIAGLWVTLGRPGTAPAPEPVAQVTEAPVATPALATVELTVKRGDTFHKLLANQDMDVAAVVAAARPLVDLSRLEVGDKVELVLAEDGHTVQTVRYSVDARSTLVVQRGATAWTAAIEKLNS